MGAPDPIGEGGFCAERLSNLIPGMDGFWLEACQWSDRSVVTCGATVTLAMFLYILYSKFDLPPFPVMVIVWNILGLVP